MLIRRATGAKDSFDEQYVPLSTIAVDFKNVATLIKVRNGVDKT